MALQIIGAGLGRTGTLTLKTALEMLGFGPCHHMTEVIANPGQMPFWNRAARGDAIEWDEVYGAYRATVDWPGAYFYAQLAERYPEAKVILSWRDPQRWCDSMTETILKAMALMGQDKKLRDDHPMYFRQCADRPGHLRRGLQPEQPHRRLRAAQCRSAAPRPP